MKTKVDIERVLKPNKGELNFEGDDVTAVILDAELDPLDCSFDFSDSVTISTGNYQYITLSSRNLRKLIELIEQSEDYFTDTLDE